MKTRKVKVNKTYYTTEGTLYKDSIVRVEKTTKSSVKSQIRVKDELGKIYYIDIKDLVLL